MNARSLLSLQEALDGYRKCMRQESDLTPEQARQRAMNDPEIQQIMGDPSMQMILQQMQQNPGAINEYVVLLGLNARVCNYSA